jgi:hypothetical protein
MCSEYQFGQVLGGGRSRPDIRFIPFAVTGFGALAWRPCRGFFYVIEQAAIAKGYMHAGSERFLWPSMAFTRTKSCAGCPPPWTVWRPLLPPLMSSALVLQYDRCNSNFIEASIATVNVASEVTSGRIVHGAEMSQNWRVSKASKHVGVSVTLCG